MSVGLTFCVYVEAAKEMASLDEGIHWLEIIQFCFEGNFCGWIRDAGLYGNRRCISLEPLTYRNLRPALKFKN